MRREPSLTFRGALRILGKTETPTIDKLDTLLGGVILAAGAGAAIATVGGAAVAGAAFLAPAWQWVDQKNEAGGLLRKLVTRFGSKINGAAGLERRQLVAAAHSTIVVAAYFDVFHEAVEASGFGGLTLTESEKALAAARRNGMSLMEWLYSAEIPAPSASCGFEENTAEVERWLVRLHSSNEALLRSLDLWRLFGHALKEVQHRSRDRYRSYYVDLAASVPEFAIWAALGEHAATRDAVDRSFGRIEKLLTSLGAPVLRTPAAAQVIERANHGRLNDRVVQATLPWPNSTVRFPTVAELFVPPKFRITPHDDDARASDERWWSKLPLRDDIAGRLAAHILSPAATRAPLLLLGHPGAGKSMLTKVLAAHLPAADYTTVNVALRAVSAHASILDQIQQALDRVTHRRVQWAELADETADRLRVVLLDGLDELLQASDLDRTGYLHDVVRFQELEADQERPVAVVVTSRTVVADRVDIPEGTTLVKLADFDDEQIEAWLAHWNEATGEGQAHQLTREEALHQPHLARQPLLLMLLALYAGSPGVSELFADSSTAALYDQLFRRFAGREAAKNADDRPYDEAAAVETSIDRLSIAALAMFNRGQQQIAEAQLGKDLEALTEGSASRRPEATGQRLLAEFFFVHADEATVVGGRQSERSYEFLHATFGEYLVARKILEVLRDVADAAFGGRRAQRDPEDDLLQALLGHQVLAGRRPIVQFAGEIFGALPDGERSDLLAVLDHLIRRWRSRPPADRYRAYSPTSFDQVRHAATYSANLVMLRLAVAEGNRVAMSDLLPGESSAEWESLVTLWRAGLDSDAWRATLGALTLDRRSGEIVAAPPGHGHAFPDFDYARLLGDHDTASRLGMGIAVLDGVHGLLDADLDWVVYTLSRLIPPIAFLETDDIVLRPPPQETRPRDLNTVAGGLEKMLKTRAADLSLVGVERVVGLLLDLDHEPDSTALAVALCEHPNLLISEPRMRDAELYRGADATVLMMYAARDKVADRERHHWDELYAQIRAGSTFRPQDHFHGSALEMLRKLWSQVVPRYRRAMGSYRDDRGPGRLELRGGRRP